MSDWMDRARAAKKELSKAKHGQRESILLAVGDGLNPNTVRREIQALAFLDRLSKTNPEFGRALKDASFGSVEVLARWSSFDERGAFQAAKKLAVGDHSLKSLKSAMLGARRQHAVPTRKEFLREVERSISGPVSALLGGRLTAADIPSKRLGGPPIDLLFRRTLEGAPAQSVAAIVVGPYRSAALYSKRRHDELWRAMGMAWKFDHVIVVLPSPGSVAEYQRWLIEAGVGSALNAQTRLRARRVDPAPVRRPSVLVVGIEDIPDFSGS